MRDNKIKPIETYYDGYKFRSRLEARWAVFFNTVRTPYQYEPEGFDLGLTWYLPDFFLPELGTWVEIKPLPLPFDEFGDVRDKGSILTIHTQAGPTAIAKMLLLKDGLSKGKISRQHFIFYGIPGIPQIEAIGADWQLLSGSLGFSPDIFEGNIYLRAAAFALVDGARQLAIWPYYMDKARPVRLLFLLSFLTY